MGLRGITENHLLLVSIFASFGLHMLIIYVPLLRNIFGLTPLTLKQIGLSALVGSSALLIIPQWLIERRWYHPLEEGEGLGK
jgi:magnesium-transporting ATPase (P-type)